MKRVYLFLNGDLPGDEDYYRHAVSGGMVFCADGGANHSYRLGIRPSLIMGDCDSIHADAEKYYRNEGVRFETFSPEKDSSDAELLIDKAVSDGYDELILFGGFGGRVDHLVGNILLLEKYSGSRISVVMKSPDSEIRIIEREYRALNDKGKNVSLFAVTESAVVTLNGFAYPLNEEILRRGSTLGLSNRIASDAACITVHKGKVLMIKGENR